MKSILFASTALALTAGAAAAEVTVGGDGRMGVIYNNVDEDLEFTSRIRISFTASGETDGGLTFGGSVRADNAAGGANGAAGNVYISGAFGKLSMGDVDSAAQAAVGQVSGVGLFGTIRDLHEVTYIGEGSDTDCSTIECRDPVALYEYSFGDGTVYVSLGDGVDDVSSYGVGVEYSFGNFGVQAGYEKVDFDDDAFADISQYAVGASASFGDATIKAIYTQYEYDGFDDSPNDIAVSVDYVWGMTTVTAFYASADADISGVDNFERYGLGASYDLGGGAQLVGGIVGTNEDIGDDDDFMAADFGIKMTF